MKKLTLLFAGMSLVLSGCAATDETTEPTSTNEIEASVPVTPTQPEEILPTPDNKIKPCKKEDCKNRIKGANISAPSKVFSNDDTSLRAQVMELMAQEYNQKKSELKEKYLFDRQNIEASKPKYFFDKFKYNDEAIADLEEVIQLAKSGWYSPEDMKSVELTLQQLYLTSEQRQLQDFKSSLLEHELQLVDLNANFKKDQAIMDSEFTRALDTAKVEAMIEETFMSSLTELEHSIKTITNTMNSIGDADDWTITEQDVSYTEDDEETQRVDLNSISKEKP